MYKISSESGYSVLRIVEIIDTGSIGYFCTSIGKRQVSQSMNIRTSGLLLFLIQEPAISKGNLVLPTGAVHGGDAAQILRLLQGGTLRGP